MPHETFTGTAIPELLARANERFGEGARIVSLARRNDRPGWTLVAASDAIAANALRAPGAWPPPAFRTAMTPQLSSLAARRAGVPASLAVVGPTGSGKTTTLAKLANREDVFGGLAVGFLCLDTYRVGAIEQARHYARLSRLPIAVASDAAGIAIALRKLARCEIVLVDTPGRGPSRRGDLVEIAALLRELAPAETHLAIPAGLEPRRVRRALAEHRVLNPTHLVATKLDECPDDTSVFDLAVESALPMRWVTTGQEVPDDLEAAWLRVIARMQAPARAREEVFA